MLDLAHHVIAQIAEQAGRHGRQAGRQFHARGLDQSAQRIQRPGFLRHIGAARQGMMIDLGHIAAAAPDQIGFQADDGIAAARFPALHAFQQEGILLAFAQLEKSRDWRFQIGDKAAEQDLRPAGPIKLRERLVIRRQTHDGFTTGRRWSAAGVAD